MRGCLIPDPGRDPVDTGREETQNAGPRYLRCRDRRGRVRFIRRSHVRIMPRGWRLWPADGRAAGKKP